MGGWKECDVSIEPYGIGLAVRDAGRDICWVGKGGMSSGEASNLATRSLNEAFLDLKPLGMAVAGFELLPVKVPFDNV
jgi:hypothetical protein